MLKAVQHFNYYFQQMPHSSLLLFHNRSRETSISVNNLPPTNITSNTNLRSALLRHDAVCAEIAGRLYRDRDGYKPVAGAEDTIIIARSRTGRWQFENERSETKEGEVRLSNEVPPCSLHTQPQLCAFPRRCLTATGSPSTTSLITPSLPPVITPAYYITTMNNLWQFCQLNTPRILLFFLYYCRYRFALLVTRRVLMLCGFQMSVIIVFTRLVDVFVQLNY